MQLRKLLVRCFFIFLVLTGFNINAQDYYQPYRQEWLKKAEENKPHLVETIKQPRSVVKLVKDEAAFQHWKAVYAGGLEHLYNTSLKQQPGIVVDFGEHLTGHFTFTIKAIGHTSEAPVRLKFTFGEVPAELATPFDPYPAGSLSRAWLQDEMVTVTDFPSTITIPRRLAFRYLKIDIVDAFGPSDFAVTGMHCKASTSVTDYPAPLATGTDPLIVAIDKVGLNTLKECMQTVYEDGPKRDRRLWIGDLYLESLANGYSFKKFELTKRCLYMLAGVAGEDGYLNPDAFEAPEPHAQPGDHILDYALLYNAALKEYLEATGDRKTGLDLWPVAKKQLDLITKYILQNDMMDGVAAAKQWWLFFDWKPGLDKQASLQGLTIFVLNNTYALAKFLGKEKEVAELPDLIKKMKIAARKTLYDKKTKLFLSGPNKQVSYASQAWMILSGVATKAEGQAALTALPAVKSAIHPGAPYMYHYYIAALLECGLQKEAKAALMDYWGGMVKKGADTFWEVYDPSNELLSPYNFFPVNSYCHAWSCTPVYFIRKYPEIFQK